MQNDPLLTYLYVFNKQKERKFIRLSYDHSQHTKKNGSPNYFGLYDKLKDRMEKRKKINSGN